MPTSATVRIVSNRIPELPAALRERVARQVSITTYDVEARAKAVVPVRTGTLRRSIHSVFRNGGLTGICGPSVLYGIFVEFGTRYMSARPFMRPAAEGALPRFVEGLKAILQKEPL